MTEPTPPATDNQLDVLPHTPPPPSGETDVRLGREPSGQQPPVRLMDLVAFCFGNQRAITAVLQSRSTLWLGGLLVVSAAIGREYDAVSLIHRPWELLGSFAASLVMCTILFGFIYVCLACVTRSETKPFQEYLTFLGGYWMTAPLAWFYAFPIESVSDELTSIYFNLIALSLVSIWRVLLFSRVVSIQFALPYVSSLIWVLVPCMAVAFIALFSALLPMVAVMGGIRLTRTQQVLVDYQGGVMMIIFYSAIPMLIAFLISLRITQRKRPARPEVCRLGGQISRRMGSGPWWLAATAIVGLLLFSLPFQKRYWHAAEIDRMIAGGRIDEAIERLEANGPQMPPATWDPLPRGIARGPDQVDLLPIVEALVIRQAPAWLNDLLLVQADEIILRQAGHHFGTRDMEYVSRWVDNMELEELRALEYAFAQLNRLERSNVEEQRRVAELHQLIVAALDKVTSKQPATQDVSPEAQAPEAEEAEPSSDD